MKIRNGIIFAVAFFGLLAIGCQNTNMNNIPERVILKYVDLEIQTPFDVGCDSLESYFGKQVSILTLTNKQFLDSLAAILTVLRPSKEGFMPDVRLVMLIRYPNNETHKLCMGITALALNGVATEFEPRLLSLIQNELKKHGKQLDSN